MSLHEFPEKLIESQNPQLSAILEKVYRDFYAPGIVMSVEADDTERFQRNGCDIKVTLRGTRGSTSVQTLEEKIRSPKRSKYDDLLIETISNQERGTAGWIYTSNAEWLSYVRQPDSEIIILILPMQSLRQWFTLQKLERFDEIPAYTAVGDTQYQTLNRVVPMSDPQFHWFMMAHGAWKKRIQN